MLTDVQFPCAVRYARAFDVVGAWAVYGPCGTGERPVRRIWEIMPPGHRKAWCARVRLCTRVWVYVCVTLNEHVETGGDERLDDV